MKINGLCHSHRGRFTMLGRQVLSQWQQQHTHTRIYIWVCSSTIYTGNGSFMSSLAEAVSIHVPLSLLGHNTTREQDFLSHKPSIYTTFPDSRTIVPHISSIHLSWRWPGLAVIHSIRWFLVCIIHFRSTAPSVYNFVESFDWIKCCIADQEQWPGGPVSTFLATRTTEVVAFSQLFGCRSQILVHR